MSGVDNRIVTMKFDNKQFEQGAKTSMSTLAKLKESLNFGSIVGGSVRALGTISSALSKIGIKTPFTPMINAANKGLAGVGTVLGKLGLNNPFATATKGAADLGAQAADAGGPRGMGILEGGVTSVSSKFIALSTIAITALSNITNRVINAGTQWLKSFSFAPIMDGLHEYELNLKSIQTIQANTDRPLGEVQDSLNQLNKYSDQTIYNFSEMARNVGTFTAAGVDLQTSVSSIKGIANLAALSGSSSEQAATAMYQLSQAIASGKVGLMDWNSVVNAGMGGKKLQNALAQTAIAMGKIDEAQVKGTKSGEQLKIAGQSFRESIMAKPGQESWLSSDILVNTLATMDGRFSKAALAAEKTAGGLQKYSKAQIEAKIQTARTNLEQKNGVKFSDEQFKALQSMSTKAFQAATQVKTLGQVFDVAKETIGSGWSASFTNIFGNLTQAKKLFTGMSNTLNAMINQNALARNKILSAWSKGGGRSAVIEGLKNAWQGLMNVLSPIHEAFRDLFPAQTGKSLIELSKNFKHFTKDLIPGVDTMYKLRDIFHGVFAVFDILKQVVVGVATGLKTLFTAVGGGNGDFLQLLANIGGAVYQFDRFLKGSGLITSFFTSFGAMLSIPLQALKGLAHWIGSIFDGFNTGKSDAMSKSVDGVSKSFTGFTNAADAVRGFMESLSGMFEKLGELLGKGVVNIGHILASMLTSDAFKPALDAINTGLLLSITVMLKKWFAGGSNIDLTGGFFSHLGQTLSGVSGSLEALQANLKANVLLKIGASIAVLAGALYILSTIDPGKLRMALAAMSAGFAVLISALVILIKTMGPVGIFQIYAVSSAMTKMAFAILLLALALKTMAGIRFSDMLRGLIGLSITLKIVEKALTPMAANSKGMLKAAASLILVGIALNILAVALKIFATMSWEEMAKGLTGLIGVLAALAIGLRAMPPIKAEAVQLLALGVAMNLLAVALKIFATMSWEEMAKGLLMLTGALVGIGLGMRMMPKGMLLQSVALVAVAGAMVVLSGALAAMGAMSWEAIGKGLVTLAGAMLILAIGLNAMGPAAIMGAAALVVTAAALAVLVPTIALLGSLPINTILIGLGALAALFVILGLAGLALAPVTPVIIGLSAALLMIGGALALAGVGAMAAATAFGIIVGVGVAAAQVLAAVLATVIAAIPPAMKAFGQGVVAFAVAIGNGAPKIGHAFGQILSNFLTQVRKNAPKLAKTVMAMLNAFLMVVNRATPKIVETGLHLIVSFLAAVSKHVPEMVNKGADIVVKFLQGLGKNIGRIADAAAKMIIKFIHAVADAIRNNSEEMGRAGGDLVSALVSGAISAFKGAASSLATAAKDALKSAWEGAKHFFGVGGPSTLMCETVGKPIMLGVASGMKNNRAAVVGEMADMGQAVMTKMKTIMDGVHNAIDIDPNFNPTVTPVLDLAALSKEANKMSTILATNPIVPTVSYQKATDISTAFTTAGQGPNDGTGGPDDGSSSGGPIEMKLEQHLHSPKPIDSVESYKAGKSLIALAKEVLKT